MFKINVFLEEPDSNYILNESLLDGSCSEVRFTQAELKHFIRVNNINYKALSEYVGMSEWTINLLLNNENISQLVPSHEKKYIILQNAIIQENPIPECYRQKGLKRRREHDKHKKLKKLLESKLEYKSVVNCIEALNGYLGTDENYDKLLVLYCTDKEVKEQIHSLINYLISIKSNMLSNSEIKRKYTKETLEFKNYIKELLCDISNEKELLQDYVNTLKDEKINITQKSKDLIASINNVIIKE